ncbi:hypothetical protein B0H14DRAFT_3491076 [Mycena olivaceomarginata]|nr:hypothetical protein B0H14DRAFT_3491076 [Mycena olivaceomarginata]
MFPMAELLTVDEGEENLDVLADDSRTFELPLDVTPPPRPNQRPIELIPFSDLQPPPGLRRQYTHGPTPPNHTTFPTTTSARPAFPSLTAVLWVTNPIWPLVLHLPDCYDVSSNDPCNTTRTTCPSPTISTLSQELESVQKALASITTASLDIVSLHARFGALPSSTVAADRALCDRVGKTIHAVQEAVRRHRAVPAEQWWLRSASCRRKYDHRLMSLQRTLSRFHALCSVSPRVNRIHKLRKLLEQHEAKLAGLGCEIQCGMFDRLHRAIPEHCPRRHVCRLSSAVSLRGKRREKPHAPPGSTNMPSADKAGGPRW